MLAHFFQNPPSIESWANIEQTFARVLDLTRNLGAEEKRASEENMTQDAYELIQMLFKDTIAKT